MGKRDDRRNAIRILVQKRHIKTQKQLAALLKEQGFSCTQATISRDVAEMGLEKISHGFFRLPEEYHLSGVILQLTVSVVSAQNIVVVKTLPGAAQGVSAALDSVEFKGALGTVAGDDTIMIITETSHAAKELVREIEQLREGKWQ